MFKLQLFNNYGALRSQLGPNDNNNNNNKQQTMQFAFPKLLDYKPCSEKSIYIHGPPEGHLIHACDVFSSSNMLCISLERPGFNEMQQWRILQEVELLWMRLCKQWETLECSECTVSIGRLMRLLLFYL